MAISKALHASVVLSLLALCPVVAAEPPTSSHAPVFEFSADNKINQSPEQFTAQVIPSARLREDAWLNAPLTRLDYVLMRMEAKLTSSLSMSGKSGASEYFEPSEFYSEPDLDVGGGVF